MAMDELMEINTKHRDDCVGYCGSTNFICDREKAPKMTILDWNGKPRTIPIGEIKINSVNCTIKLCPQWDKITKVQASNLYSDYEIDKCYSSAYENIILTIYDYIKWHVENKENQ